jgi:hypothetical protein
MLEGEIDRLDLVPRGTEKCLPRHSSPLLAIYTRTRTYPGTRADIHPRKPLYRIEIGGEGTEGGCFGAENMEKLNFYTMDKYRTTAPGRAAF